MTLLNDEHDLVPWYKQGYVWMVIFFPSLAVIGGIAMLYMAINSFDGLVVDDYYKQGLEINRVIERDKVAETYQLEALVNVDLQREEISVQLLATNDFTYPETLEVSFLNATRAGVDKQLKLIKVDKDLYRSSLSPLPIGKWYMHIHSDNWRIVEIMHVAKDGSVY